MATPNVVPRADQEGGIGTSAKSWGKLFIQNPTAGGTAAATISNLDADQKALNIDAAANTTGEGVYILTSALTSAKTLFAANSGGALTASGRVVHGRHIDTSPTVATTISHELGYDTSSSVSGGNSSSKTVLEVSLEQGGSGNAGTLNMVGINNNLVTINNGGANDNTDISQIGIINDIRLGTVAKNVGLYSDVTDGGLDVKFVSSVDSGDFFSIGTTTHGATTITTVDDDATAADLTFTIDGAINFNAASGIVFNEDGAAVDFRIESDDETHMFFLDGSTNRISIGESADDPAATLEVTNHLNSGATGVPLMQLNNRDTDQISLDINAIGLNHTANVIDITTAGLTTGKVLHADINDSNTSSVATEGLIHIDFDKSGVTADGATRIVKGIDIDLTDSATNHASGNVQLLGQSIDLVSSSNQGGITHNLLNLTSSGADAATTTGINLNTTDGGTDLKIVSSADTGDFFSIATTTHGATTVTTVDDDAAAANLTFSIDGTFEVDTGANEIDLTTTGTLDVNANALLMDLTDSSSIVLTASEAAEDLLIRVSGAHDSSLLLRADGTGADAIGMNATAGSIDIDSADNITIDAADLITITTADTGADGLISLVSGVAGANTAIHLDGNANAASVVDIDAGILDIDASAAITIDGVGIALGAGSGELDLTTTGTMDINSAALDIDTSGAIAIDAAGAASDIFISTAHTAGVAFHLDANANAASEVQIDAGILDVDVTGAATIDAVGIALGAGAGELDLTTTGTLDMNANAFTLTATDSSSITVASSEDAEDLTIKHFGAHDSSVLITSVGGTGADAVGISTTVGSILLDSADNIKLDAEDNILLITNTADGLITLESAHTAGQAIHIDGDADAGSIVDIDAGILDIDVTAAATIDAVGISLDAGSGVLNLASAVTGSAAAAEITRVISQGPGYHMIVSELDVFDANETDNGVIKQLTGIKIPQYARIVDVVLQVVEVSNLGTYDLNLLISSQNSVSAGTAPLAIHELIGAGAGNAGSTDDIAGGPVDVELGSGEGNLKKQFHNYRMQDVLASDGELTVDHYVYICSAGTGNGTTDATSGRVVVYIEYYGID